MGHLPESLEPGRSRPRRRRFRRGLRHVAVVVLGLVVGGVIFASRPLPRPSARASRPEWIGPVHVVDVVSGTVARDRALRVSGDRIAAVVPWAQLPPGTAVHPAGGAYAAPGLWDMHAVLTRYADALEQPLALAHGITRLRSILDCPAEGRVNLYACASEVAAWNDEVRAGRLLGPLVMGTGTYPVNGPARPHPDAPADHAAGTAEQARALVARLAASTPRPHHVKTYDELPREAFFALLDAARAARLEVSGHIPAAVGVEEASNAGLRAIAHARALPIGCSSREDEIVRLRAARRPAREWLRVVLESQDEARCAALLETLRRNGTWISPTLVTRFNETRRGMAELQADEETRRVTPSLVRLLWQEDVTPVETRSDEDDALHQRFYDLASARTAQAARAGVRLLVGSDTNDAWIAPGLGFHKEVELWRRAGIPAAAILRSATAEAADYFGRGADQGRIEPGFVADLVLTAANPLDDPSALRRPQAVIQEGRLYDRATLDAAVEHAASVAAGAHHPLRLLVHFARNPSGYANRTRLRRRARISTRPRRRS